MYIVILALLLLPAAGLIVSGLQRRQTGRVAAGAVIGAAALLFFWFMGFWGEKLWFDALGYSQRFWTLWLTQAALTAGAAVFGFLAVFLLTAGMGDERKLARLIAVSLGALGAAGWGFINWDTLLIFAKGVVAGVQDPILQRDTGFYLFTLPFYEALYDLFLLLLLVALAPSVIYLLPIGQWAGTLRDEPFGIREASPEKQFRPLFWPAAALFLVLAWGKYLNRYHLLYSTWGVVTGPGWTDVHIRLPAYWAASILTALVGILLLLPFVREKILAALKRRNVPPERRHSTLLGGAAALVFGSWLVLLFAAPGLMQWLRVEPNEISLERPYIAHNIGFTRQGFGLEAMEVKEFPVSGDFDWCLIRTNQKLFANVRLWDWRALDEVYKQFQEIRLYYEFADVDIDRYTFGGDYRQVMISARELELGNLPADSRTFVNLRFKYTHGYGITLNTVNEFTPEGLPNLLVKDIPPQSAHQEIEVSRPQIYYGELTRTPVVVNSREAELDYPSGDENEYIRYPGQGGVEISNLWRKFLFGWKFDGTRFLLSGYPEKSSRIMFHRQIEERLKTLAPFLHFDQDPYIVLADGRLYWIVDAYTTSRKYPYSEPFSAWVAEAVGNGAGGRRAAVLPGHPLHGVNYIRNSVKAVVDAFEGKVDFYVFAPQDPLIRVWQKVFPGLFKPREAMNPELAAHVRYPADLLQVQGLVYAKYHMTDPTVFYNQEDLWVQATETYYGDVRPVDPYYIMWEPPGRNELEFVLMQPFTPKNKQVLIGWIAGMCDGDNYGRLLAYQFPKEKRILGTQQVESKIDQNAGLASKMTLWDQRGSRVIRGNVLVIPVEKTLFYVEPIYLKAETAAYPELRLVTVMHDDRLSYASNFEDTLKGLLAGGGEPAPGALAGPPAAVSESAVAKAQRAFDDYLDHMGEERFDAASRALADLRQALNSLSSPTGERKK